MPEPTERTLYDRIRNAWPGPVSDADLTDEERCTARKLERKGLVELIAGVWQTTRNRPQVGIDTGS